MRQAAATVGASLLPALPEEMAAIPCESTAIFQTGDAPFCVRDEGNDDSAGPLLAVLDSQGRPAIAIAIPSQDWYYARVARRGSTLVLLMPKVSRRKLGVQSQCTCGTWGTHTPVEHVLVIEGLSTATLQTLEVPMTERYVEWKCEAYLADASQTRCGT